MTAPYRQAPALDREVRHLFGANTVAGHRTVVWLVSGPAGAVEFRVTELPPHQIPNVWLAERAGWVTVGADRAYLPGPVHVRHTTGAVSWLPAEVGRHVLARWIGCSCTDDAMWVLLGGVYAEQLAALAVAA